MTLGRYVLTADVTVPAGTQSFPAAGPATAVSGTTSATPAGGTTVTSQSLASGTFLLSWTVSLQSAAAAGDANNSGLYSGTTLLATSVNAGAVGTYPQAAVTAYLGTSPTTVAVKTIAAGTAGSVYGASLTATPLLSGDSKGAVAWTGQGSPPQWTPGGFGVTFLQGTPLWLDTAGPLYALLSGSVRAWIDGTDSVGGHGHWGLSN